MRQAVFVVVFLLCLALSGLAGAVNGQTIPPCHCTMPDAPEPWRQLTYAPIHALEGFGDGR